MRKNCQVVYNNNIRVTMYCLHPVPFSLRRVVNNKLKSHTLIGQRFRIKAILFPILILCFTACQFEQSTPSAPVIGAIAYGQTVQGNLSSAENHWLFIAKANDTITLEF